MAAKHAGGRSSRTERAGPTCVAIFVMCTLVTIVFVSIPRRADGKHGVSFSHSDGPAFHDSQMSQLIDHHVPYRPLFEGFSSRLWPPPLSHPSYLLQPECIAWRQTGGCRPDGPREPFLDASCSTEIPSGRSGYCECRGGTRARETTCDRRRGIRCSRACAEGLENVHEDDEPREPEVTDAVVRRGKLLYKAVRGTVATSRNSQDVIGAQCVGWRQTAGCDPSGPREPSFDKSCSALIPSGFAGFCECGEGVPSPAVPCNHRAFTCKRLCEFGGENSQVKEVDSFYDIEAESDALNEEGLDVSKDEMKHLDAVADLQHENAKWMQRKSPDATDFIAVSQGVSKGLLPGEEDLACAERIAALDRYIEEMLRTKLDDHRGDNHDGDVERDDGPDDDGSEKGNEDANDDDWKDNYEEKLRERMAALRVRLRERATSFGELRGDGKFSSRHRWERAE